MESQLFYLTRKIERIGDTKTKHTLEWKIPNFIWLLNNQTNREIKTNKPEKADNEDDINDEKYNFELKMKFVGQENDLVEIYYMSRESVFVDPSNCIKGNYSRGSFLFSNLKHQMHSNKWQLLAAQFKRNLIAEGYSLYSIMSLTFEFSVCHSHSNDIKKEPVEVVQYPQENVEELCMPNCNLIDDVTSLLMNTTFSDVTLKSIEGVKFPAHKNLLGSRSAVLNAHFMHNTVENATNVVEFPFETDVLKDVLCYIYTDDAPNIDTLSRKLLDAAEFYQLNGLKKLSLKALEKNLTVENAIETLELATLYRAKNLKKTTLEFIKDGPAGEITKSECWQKLQSAEALIIKSVFEFIVNYKLV